MVSNLMNVLEGEFLCLCEISINVNKLLAVLLLPVYLHTYIISHYNNSVRIIVLVSHTTYVLWVNFIYKWRDLPFKVVSERQIFWEAFHGNFIYSESFCQKSALSVLLFFFFFFVFSYKRQQMKSCFILIRDLPHILRNALLLWTRI